MPPVLGLLLLLLLLFLPPTGHSGSASIPLSGEVRDAAGEPIGAATVRLYPVRSVYEKKRREALDLGPSHTVETKTDAAGRFRLAAPDAGMWHLEIEAEGFVSRGWSFLPLLETQELPAATLERSAGVAVRVVDPQGKPVAGARVIASPVPREGAFDDWPGEDWSAAARQGVTDEAGRLSLPRGKDEELRLTAFARGFLFGATESSEATVEVTLTPGCPRRLDVTLAGKPFADAVALAVGRGRGVSNEMGRIELLTRCGEETAVDVLTADGRKVTRLLPPPSGKGPEKPLPVELPEPERVAGRVIAADTKEAIADAWVYTYDDPGASSRSDAMGAFSVAPAATKHLTLRAAAPGYFADDGLNASRDVEAILALIPAAFANGQVVDADGQPVSGALVRAAPEEGGYPFDRASHEVPGQAVSNATGRFRLPLSPATTYTLNVTHAEYAQTRDNLEPIPARTARTDLRIVLVRGRTATGRVVDGRRQPIGDARVLLAAIGSGGFSSRRLGRTPPLETTTGADGRFAIPHLAAGFYDLAAGATGWAPTAVRGVSLTGPSGPIDLGTLVLRPAVGLEGKVVDEEGAPLAGAKVTVTSSSPLAPRFDLPGLSPQSVRSGSDGRFAFSGLPPDGAARLGAAKEDYLQADASVNLPTEAPVKLILRRAAGLRGCVVDSKSRPIEDATVTLLNPEPASYIASQWTGPEGRFSLSDLEPGKVTLSVTASGFLPLEKDLELLPGRTADAGTIALGEAGDNRLDLQLEAGGDGGELRGRVVDEASLPVAGVKVCADQIERRKASLFAETGADGTFRFALAPGTYHVEAWKPGFPTTPLAQPVRIEPGATAEVELRLEGGGTLRGRITGLDSSALAQVHVIADYEGPLYQARKKARLSSQGDYHLDYHLEDLTPGEWKVDVGWQGRWVSKVATVVAGKETVLDVESAGELTLSGRVERAGRPVEEAHVFVAAVGQGALVQATTGLDGSFRITGLAPGIYEVSVLGSERWRLLHALRVELDRSRAIVLSLPTRRLTGRTLDSVLLPVAGAIVAADPVPGGERNRTSVKGAGDGSFALEGLASGTYDLLATKDGYGPAKLRMEVQKGDLEGVDLILEPGNDLLFTVTSRSGRRLQSVFAALLDTSGAALLRRTLPRDEKGRVTLSGCPRGSFRLLIAAEGAATTAREVTVPGKPFHVALAPGGWLNVRLSGKLRGRVGDPVISLFDREGRPFYHLAGNLLVGTEIPLWRYATLLQGIPPGLWKVRLTLADGQVLERKVSVTADAVADVSFE